MTRSIRRRDFLRATSTAAAAAGALGVWRASPAAEPRSANEKLSIAFVGVANKGGHNVAQLRGENVYALCDVDAKFLGQAAGRYAKAKQYRDFRKLLEAEAKNLDAVCVSTADHTHAPATALALSLGKHVYCEKPLTHTVAEARHVAKLAKEKKVATQMGTQIHAGENYRRVVEIVLSGSIGTVSEVFTWCNKGWSNGRFRTTDQPAPHHLDWDLWLGPAKTRPFSPSIHPSNWRRFWEYGSGTFGDMACHIMDLPFWALDLRHPISVQATGPEVHPDGCPSWCMADYEFPRGDGQSPLKYHWSDGGKHHDLVAKTVGHDGKPLSKWGLGVLFVGSKGMLAANYGAYQLFPKEKFADYQPPGKSIPRSIGHWNEWVKACKTGSGTTCNFEYSGALTETVLLGTVAYRTGKTLQWDAARLKATNCSAADEYIAKEYRQGWELAT